MYRNFLLVLLILCTYSSAQDSPEEYLGYQIGSRFTAHHQLTGYFQHLADQYPDRIKIEEYGRTYENRPLKLAYISSAENLQKIDAIKRSNHIRAGMLSDDEQPEDITTIWFSFNVHGNEASASEASMLIAFYLLTNPRASDWLKNCIVIIDPCLNPDGRDRYVQWINSMTGSTPNPNLDAIEHNEPWPGGRYNHYLFDLNRDWAWQTQIESQLRLEQYHQWKPQIHVDFHEQSRNSPYYFAPAAIPYHRSITDWQRNFQQDIGQNNARYFDSNKWLYFTKERFDLFYPSYGDTYPTFNGAIGMTYEKAGGGSAGLSVITEDGDTLSLAERALQHFTAGVSTIETVAANAARILDEFEAYHQPIKHDYNTYIIKGNNNPDALRSFLSYLKKNKITYSKSGQQRSMKGFAYHSGKEESFSLQSEDVIISTQQPQHHLVNVLLEPNPELEDSITYDITAWSLIYNHNLEAYAMEEVVKGTMEYIEPQNINKVPQNIPYAYIAHYEGLEDLRFLSYLHQQGVKVRVAKEPFAIGNNTFKRGALVITHRANQKLGKNFNRTVVQGANLFGKKLFLTNTGLVDRGKDFGSGKVVPLEAPGILVVRGNGVSATSFGAVWYFIDQYLSYPATVINIEQLPRVNLAKYSHIILPDGSYYQGTLESDRTRDKLETWVRQGGSLVVLGGAIEEIAGYEWAELKTREKPSSEGPIQKSYAAEERDYISETVSGSIYKNSLDPTHPLAYSIDKAHFFSLKTSRRTFEPLEDGWNVAINSSDRPVAGFSGNRIASQKEALTLGVHEVGRGRVVYFVDDPLFRAFWYTGKKLFANTLFFSNL